MNAFNAYCIFLAIRLHFRGSFDYAKYGAKKIRKETFEAKLEPTFSKFAKYDNVELFFACNFFHNKNLWWNTLVDNECVMRYNQSRATLGSIKYYIEEELSKYSSLDDAFVPPNGNTPKIIQSFYRHEIRPEVLVILSDALQLIPYWDKYMSEDPLWNETKFRLKKYKHFLPYNKHNIYKAIDTFNTR